MEPSTNVDNPTPTPDVAKGGDALTDLAQASFDKFPAPSEGETVSTQTPPAPADKTGQPEGDEPQPDDTGKVTRLEQALSKQRQTLQALGIDPDSDLIDKINAGFVTKDDLLKPSIQPTPTTQQTPLDEFGQFISDLEQKKTTGVGFVEEDFLKSLKLTKALAAENAQVREQQQFDALYKQCQGATLSVLDKDQTHTQLPEDIQKIENHIFWVSTNDTLGNEAASLGNPPSYYTPRSYNHYAERNLKTLDQYRKHFIQVGRRLEREAINPTPKPTTVNPISPGTGGAPIQQPEPTIKNFDDMEEAARRYKTKLRAVI